MIDFPIRLFVARSSQFPITGFRVGECDKNNSIPRDINCQSLTATANMAVRTIMLTM